MATSPPTWRKAEKNCTGGFTHKGVNTEYANYAFELGFSRNIATLVDQIH